MHITGPNNSYSDSGSSLQNAHSLVLDQYAINRIYDTYAPAIYGVVLDWVKQQSVAQVILQQTFQTYASECNNHVQIAKPFICLLRIARKEHAVYVKNHHAAIEIKLKEYSSKTYATSVR
jgi:hypothetical protein